MKKINLAKVLIDNRRKKNITQDVLAEHLGVSKAAVSKWETEQSYPDITLLPLIAAYFDISVDALLHYEKDLSPEEIKDIYFKFTQRFAEEDFHLVYEDVQKVVKEYYSCYRLLLQMGILLINHSMKAPTPEERLQVTEKSKTLFNLVKINTDDLNIANQARNLEALCALELGNAEESLSILEAEIPMDMDDSMVRAAAYQVLGNLDKAKEVIQVSLYQKLIGMLGIFPIMLQSYADDIEKFDTIMEKIKGINSLFQVENLHPGIMMPLYLNAVYCCVQQGRMEKALDCLETYTSLVSGDIYPLKLHGDTFFDAVTSWIDGLELGAYPPRDESDIKKDIVNEVKNQPVFAALAEEPRYKDLVRKLEKLIS